MAESYIEKETEGFEGESFLVPEDEQDSLPELPPDAALKEEDLLIKPDDATPQLPIVPVEPEDGRTGGNEDGY